VLFRSGRVGVLILLFLILSASCEHASAQALSSFTPQKAQALHQLRGSPAVSVFFNSLDLNLPAQSMALMMARYPEIAQNLVNSPIGDAVISLIQIVDSKINSSYINMPERSTQYLGRFTKIMNSTKSYTKWGEITRQVLAADPSLDWTPRLKPAVDPAVALLELEETSVTPSWMHSLDTISLVWFVLMCISIIAAIGIIILWVNMFMWKRQTYARSLVFMLSLACVVFYAGMIANQLIGVNTLVKSLYEFFHNSMLFTMVQKTDDIVGHLNDMTSLLSHSSSSSSSTGYQAYSEIGQLQENICNNAWSSDKGFFVTDAVTNTEIKIAETYMEPDATKPKALYIRYKNDGPLSTWSPIARWNAARLPGQKQIPNPSYCCQDVACVDDTGVRPSYRQCPGYYLYTAGRGNRCLCLEALQQLGFEVEATDQMNCFFDLRDNYLTIIEQMFNEDVDSMASRLVSDNALSATGCAGSYHAGGAVAVNAPGALVTLAPYSTSSFADKATLAFSREVFAQFQATSSTQQPGISWTIKNCSPGTYTFDFRYASQANVNIVVISSVHAQSE